MSAKGKCAFFAAGNTKGKFEKANYKYPKGKFPKGKFPKGTFPTKIVKCHKANVCFA